MDKTIEQQLKPCPFCGEVPTLDMIQADPSQGNKWGGVVCCIRGPEVRTGYGPVECWRDEAIAAWNTRPAPTEAEVEAAAEAIWREREGPHNRSAWKKFCRLWPVAADTYRRMARAALGVG